jgi:hypothetical protein
MANDLTEGKLPMSLSPELRGKERRARTTAAMCWYDGKSRSQALARITTAQDENGPEPLQGEAQEPRRCTCDRLVKGGELNGA